MPDFDRIDQIKQLADLLKTMPPQEGSTVRIPFGIQAKRVQWATELVTDFGVRVHPELARKEMVADGTPVNVGSDPGRAIDKVDLPFLLNLLRSTAGDVPSLAKLADDVEAAIGDPDKEAALRSEIAAQHPDLVATARQMAEKNLPEQPDL